MTKNDWKGYLFPEYLTPLRQGQVPGYHQQDADQIRQRLGAGICHPGRSQQMKPAPGHHRGIID